MDLKLNIQDSAWNAGKSMRIEEHAAQHLRLYLSGKGCDGFEYGVSFDDPAEDDLICQPSDQEKQNVDDKDRLCFIVDPETAEFVNGSEISWVDDERGKGFLVENPKHKRFRGKFFKDDQWRRKIFGKSENEGQPQP